MSLTKTTKRLDVKHIKKRTGAHHRLSKKYKKMYWPYLPVISLFVFSLITIQYLSNNSSQALAKIATLLMLHDIKIPFYAKTPRLSASQYKFIIVIITLLLLISFIIFINRIIRRKRHD